MDVSASRAACLPDPSVGSGTVLKVQHVQEMLARRARGESVGQIAAAVVVDRIGCTGCGDTSPGSTGAPTWRASS